MDLLFREYASPFVLLDAVISAGRFCDWLDTFDDQMTEKQMWEFYLHKLPPWDDRTYDDFRRGIKQGLPKKKEAERPSDEQLEATVKESFDMLNHFDMREGGE